MKSELEEGKCQYRIYSQNFLVEMHFIESFHCMRVLRIHIMMPFQGLDDLTLIVFGNKCTYKSANVNNIKHELFTSFELKIHVPYYGNRLMEHS